MDILQFYFSSCWIMLKLYCILSLEQTQRIKWLWQLFRAQNIVPTWKCLEIVSQVAE